MAYDVELADRIRAAVQAEMDGWLRVAAEVVADDDDLRGWVRRGATYARSLPPK